MIAEKIKAQLAERFKAADCKTDQETTLTMKVLHENYEVREDGTVYSRFVNRNLAPWKNNNGYLMITLVSSKGKQKAYLIHRLVAWVADILPELEDPLLEVDHKDTNKLNNAPHNLQALTKAEHIKKTLKDQGKSSRTQYPCRTCGAEVKTLGIDRCPGCYHRSSRKLKLDLTGGDIEYLYTEYGSWVSAAKALGISDNALRKRYVKLGRDAKNIKANKATKCYNPELIEFLKNQYPKELGKVDATGSTKDFSQLGAQIIEV